jgi:cytochrome c556
MKRSRFVWAAVAGAGLSLSMACVAISAGNPVAERQAAMKAIGQSMKEAAGLATGQTAWDAGKAKAVMGTVAADAKKAHGLFPAGSDKDPKTSADPKIWTNKADFDKRLTELATLASTASKATSADAFKPAFRQVGATCKGCHDLYRKKKT